MFVDDVESFLHVLGWTSLRHVPAVETNKAFRRVWDTTPFDTYSKCGSSGMGVSGVRKLLLLRSGHYPSSSFSPREATPVFDLLRKLSQPFKSLYQENPPTAEDRKKVDVPFDHSDGELKNLLFAIEQYDKDIGTLESSDWFIDTVKMALDEEKWPTDDKTEDEILPMEY